MPQKSPYDYQEEHKTFQLPEGSIDIWEYRDADGNIVLTEVRQESLLSHWSGFGNLLESKQFVVSDAIYNDQGIRVSSQQSVQHELIDLCAANGPA